MLRFLIFMFYLLWMGAALPHPSSEDRIVEIDSLLQCAHNNYADVNILSSMENALEAKARSEEINYSKGRARSNFYIAQVLSSIGDYDQSLEYLSLAEKEKFTTDNPVFFAEISRMQGRILSMLGLYRSAIHVFKKGMSHIVQV